MTASIAECRSRSVEEILAAHSIPPPRFDASRSGYTTCPKCSTLRKPANRNKPVLHVSVDRDGVQWFCNHCAWSGGEWFKPRDGIRHLVASYDYRDEAGDLLFQVVRLSPKEFRQRRPDGNGGWTWNVQGVKRILYRLPDLMAAKKAGRKIAIVVEGEKDADRLYALGAVATCNPMGAKKWRDEYSDMVRGFEAAIVIADKDGDGRLHAQQVAASLAPVVAHVKIIELPGECVKDASDFIAADGTLDEIYKLAVATADWTQAAADRETVEDSEQNRNDALTQEASPVWAEPDLAVLRLHRRPPPALPVEIFGSYWASWIEDGARAAACPVDYVVAPLLASASTLIGHARWAQCTPNWVEPPHLWCASIGDSGDGKSPGADNFSRDILPEMERRMLVDFPDRLREAQATIEAAKARAEHWKSEVREAIKAGRTPPAPPAPAPEEPLAPCLMSSDATIERVAMLLTRAAPKGLLMRRDELAGWLRGMSTYNEGARAFWIEAYGGRPYRLDRVKHPEPITIPRLAVAWHGGIQPARLAEVMRDADDGLLARFMWFWPEPVPFNVASATPEIEWAVTAFDRLRMLELASGKGGDAPQPIMVPLAPSAVQAMVRFGRLLQEEKENSGGLLRSAIGKARGLALRLSLVIEYLRWCAEDGYSAPPEVIGE
jgi:uncharacterized protein DUF3987